MKNDILNNNLIMYLNERSVLNNNLMRNNEHFISALDLNHSTDNVDH